MGYPRILNCSRKLGCNMTAYNKRKAKE